MMHFHILLLTDLFHKEALTRPFKTDNTIKHENTHRQTKKAWRGIYKLTWTKKVKIHNFRLNKHDSKFVNDPINILN